MASRADTIDGTNPISTMRHALLLGCAFGSFLAGATASAQTLGDVARKEQERRKTAPASGKVYTGDTLKPAPPPTSAPAADPAAATPAPSTPAASAPAAPQPDAAAKDSKKDEKYWRERVKRERDGLQRAEVFAEALQSRINALSADFVSRDDPAQRAVVGKDRDKALAEMERVKLEIQQHTKAIADIETEARRAGVPPGWIR
jgi:hypothetical protein